MAVPWCYLKFQTNVGLCPKILVFIKSTRLLFTHDYSDYYIQYRSKKAKAKTKSHLERIHKAHVNTRICKCTLKQRKVAIIR